MERKPIIMEPKPIVMVQAQPTIHDLLPDYAFQFQNDLPSKDASRMYDELLDFLSTNEGLATMDINDKTEYSKGFKRAIAMVKLWIDSIYLIDGGAHNDERVSNKEDTHNSTQ